jgi:FixJ family two-component response regulator
MSIPAPHIAVIDDDESYCRSVVRLLRAADYRTMTYPSAEAFLADENRPAFDCLLLDIAMDGLSGLDLQRRMAAAGSRTPVIFVTAHDDTITRDVAESLGCAAFISKVEPTGALLATLTSILSDRSH